MEGRMMQLRQLSSVGFVLVVSACSTLAPQAISGANVPPAAKVERATAKGTVTTLYSFLGQPDGANPQGRVNALTSCTDKCRTAFYGNTSSGGTNGAGTIYVLSGVATSGIYSEKVVLSYTPSMTGSNPTGPVAAHYYGPLFGTASQGGIDGNGTAIELYRGETRLLSFDGHNGASASGVVCSNRSVCYVTTFAGGRHHRGAIVSIRASHQKLVPKVVYSFSGKGDGEHPNSLTITDVAGIPYYGTTAGSKSTPGTVYSFVPGQGLTTLYAFKSSSDGVTPNGVFPLGTSVKNIRLFGTTLKGGSSGYGTLYELEPNGSTITKVTLHTFTGGSGDGAFPQGPLVSGYGVTKSGGSGGCGTIFSVSTSSGEYSSLYSFTCGKDGAYPEAPLSGSEVSGLIGTTYAGGTANKGVIFSYKP
jgi:uncharacterized repeat protein (TIGR03803 family)